MKKFKLQGFLVEPKGNLSKHMIYKDDQVIAFVLNIARGLHYLIIPILIVQFY